MTSSLTLESLIGWLEKQPAKKRYDGNDCDCCMLAQWVKSIDPRGHRSSFHSSFHYVINRASHDLIRFKHIAIEHPHDFGAALERARELQAKGEM